jgi:hypothetical protein
VVEWALRPTPATARWIWAFGAILGALAWLRQAGNARIAQLQPYDEGILYSSISSLRHGLIPFVDFYTPYGAGLGLPGLLTEAVTGKDALAVRLAYGLAPAAVAFLAPVVAARRAGPVVGIALGVIVLAQPVARYSLAWTSVLVMVLIVDRAARRSSASELRVIAAEHPRLLALAGAALGTAAWWRAEYALFAVVWAVLIVIAVRGRRGLLQAAVPLAVAGGPYAFVIAAGGLEHLISWARYWMLEGRDYRGLGISYSAPIDWLKGMWNGPYDTASAVLVASYWAAAGLLVAWILSRVIPGGRRFIGRDPTRVAVLLVIIAALVLQAGTTRFGVTQGAASLAIFWLAIALTPTRIWVRVVVCVLGVLILLPALDEYRPGRIVRDLRRAGQGATATAYLPGLEHLPVGDERWTVTLLQLRSAWRDLHLTGKSTFVVNRRNDITPGNAAVVYWWLDAPPANWLMDFDPGLADRVDEQRAAVGDLCRARAPVVQDTSPVFLNTELRPSQPRSRYLDQALALNWSPARTAGTLRVLLKGPGPCVLPDQASTQQLVARRDLLVARDDLTGAGALGLLLADRARAAGRPPDPDDVALAVLGSFYVPDRQLPPGPLGQALRSLRDGTTQAGSTEAALQARSTLTELAANAAWSQHRPPDVPPAAGARIAHRIAVMVRRHPRLELAQRNLIAVLPASSRLIASLDRAGLRGVAYDRWAFDFFRQEGDLVRATARGRLLLGLLREDPYARAMVLRDLADAYQRAGNGACAFVLFERAARVAGVVVPPHGTGPATCPAVDGMVA